MSDPAKLAAEAKRLEEDSIYSAKGHFEAARLWHTVHLAVGIAAATLAALSGALASYSTSTRIAGAIAFLVALIAGIATVLNAEKRAAAHQVAGNAYLSLRNDARFFHQIDVAPTSDATRLAEQLRKLGQRRDKLNAASPAIPRFAFERARRGIEQGEAQHQVDQG
jgi:cbb3-type cytochrome oxidase subunit 3